MKDDDSLKACGTNTTTITVTVTESSNRAPRFINNSYEATVDEGPDADGQVIVTVRKSKDI